MAFGLAVYASPRGSPQHDARLASSCWSDTTGRAFHPQGSYERFPSCFLTSLPPLPSFAWRNHIDRCRFCAFGRHLGPTHRGRPGQASICGFGPGGPGSLPTRGSHRPVRARIRAYGSSTDRFAIHDGPRIYPIELRGHAEEPRCVQHVSLDRFCRPTLRFPRQGPPRRVPLLQRYYQSATTSCRPSHRASLPPLGGTSRLHSLFSLHDGRVRRRGLELIARYLRPGC